LVSFLEQESKNTVGDSEEVACLLRAFHTGGLYLHRITPKGYGHADNIQIPNKTKWTITQRCTCPFAWWSSLLVAQVEVKVTLVLLTEMRS